MTEFRQLPVMGILRGVEPDVITPLTEAVISSGLRTIEITMNTPLAPDLIRHMVQTASGRLTIGAGTVLSIDDLHKALSAGASFIVSPVCIPDVVQYCVTNSIPVFPGALTPSEIFHAWESGATMVKVFPAKVFGPDYFKELKGGPFGNIDLLACGGINFSNINLFLANGASAVAFGGSIFSPQLIQNREFHNIETAIKDLISKGGLK